MGTALPTYRFGRAILLDTDEVVRVTKYHPDVEEGTRAYETIEEDLAQLKRAIRNSMNLMNLYVSCPVPRALRVDFNHQGHKESPGYLEGDCSLPRRKECSPGCRNETYPPQVPRQ